MHYKSAHHTNKADKLKKIFRFQLKFQLQRLKKKRIGPYKRMEKNI